MTNEGLDDQQGSEMRPAMRRRDQPGLELGICAEASEERLGDAEMTAGKEALGRMSGGTRRSHRGEKTADLGARIPSGQDQ